MFVQAVLLHRKGIGSFDPVSDGFLVFHGEPEDAGYYTWRKQGEPIPRSCTLAGVFLGDHYDNFTFEGTRNSGGLGYVENIFPILETGYQHSDFHRIFEAPADLDELIRKLGWINDLYYTPDPDTRFLPLPNHHASTGFSWKLGKEGGITEIHCSLDVGKEEIRERFYDMVREVNPSNYHDDPRLRSAA